MRLKVYMWDYQNQCPFIMRYASSREYDEPVYDFEVCVWNLSEYEEDIPY